MHPFLQFVSDDPEKSIKTFLLTAAVCYLPRDLLRMAYVAHRRLVCCLNGVVLFLPRKADAKQKSEVR